MAPRRKTNIYTTWYNLLLEASKQVELNIFDLENTVNRYNELHRCYHNIDHLIEMINLIDAEVSDQEVKNTLFIAALFHDAVYNPRANDNEEKSAELALALINNKKEADLIAKLVMLTKTHQIPPREEDPLLFHLGSILIRFDLYGLYEADLNKMIENEKKIFREYGFVDYSIYKVERLKILDHFLQKAPGRISDQPTRTLQTYINWLKQYQPNIAIYTGSFFPMHKGHKNVLKKAEAIFDKVIIGFGSNPAKSLSEEEMKRKELYIEEIRKEFPNNQIETFFNQLLPKYLKKKDYPITVVKGLRNPSDFDGEKIQLRFMEDMDPNIKVVYIISDRRYEHISSSAIKQINIIDSEETKQYI